MSKKPVKLLTLDTETIGLSGGMRRIAYYDGEQVQYGYKFEDIEPDIIELAKDYDVHIYCHNADFDLRKINVFYDDNVLWNKTLVINRRYATLACKYYTFHDSFQLLPMSLAKASKDFGLEHGKMDLWTEVQKVYPNQYKDVVDFLARCDADDEIYLKYLGYDVIALYELIQKLIEVSTIPIESLVKCPSTASMSKWLLKNGYGGKSFITEGRKYTDYQYLTKNKYWLSEKPMKGNEEVTWQETEYKIREAYYGGRTEVFKPILPYNNGEITGYYYDVNSLYPAACLNEFPIGVPEFISKAGSIKYRWSIWCKYHRGLGFIKCKVFVPKQDIPPLPTRFEKLCFLTGHLEGTWTFNELEFAVLNCGVVIEEFIEMIYFKETYKVYENFMRVFFDMKETATREENGALRAFAKLIMNCAYGWTAMKRQQIKLDYIAKADKYEDKGKLISTNKDMGYCQAESIARSETIQVQIGAYVTSYARLILLKALLQQAEKGNVYYCDTDSIICDTPMDAELVDDVKVGYWGLENVLTKGLFLQPKVYTVETAKTTMYKFKGVSKERQKHFDYDFYEGIYQALSNNQKGQIEIEDGIERLPSLITAQKRGIDPNNTIITHKSLNLENVQKRYIDYKNNRSIAWHMQSIDDFRNFSFNDNFEMEGDFFEKRRA